MELIRAVMPLLVRDEYSGSCFRLWNPNYFITARHCLGNCLPSDIEIINTSTNDLAVVKIEKITGHPQADIVILKAEGNLQKDKNQFIKISDQHI